MEGDTGKAEMPSGRLAFATRRVDNGSKYESSFGFSVRVADHSPPKKSVGKTRPDGGSSSRSACGPGRCKV